MVVVFGEVDCVVIEFVFDVEYVVVYLVVGVLVDDIVFGCFGVLWWCCDWWEVFVGVFVMVECVEIYIWYVG